MTTPTPPPYNPPKKWHQKRWVRWTAGILLVSAVIGAVIGEDPVEPVSTSAAATTAPPTTEAPTTTTTTAPPTTTTTTTTTTTAPPIDRRVLMRVAVDSTWNNMTFSEQREICDGVDLFGAETVAAMIFAGAEGEIDLDIINEAVEGWC